jgi:hypothetical protein
MHSILQDRYPKHDEFIERLAFNLQTQKDWERFNSFVADLYEMGYFKATNDYQDVLGKAGYNVKVIPQPTETDDDGSNRIFPQEKSG